MPIQNDRRRPKLTCKRREPRAYSTPQAMKPSRKTKENSQGTIHLSTLAIIERTRTESVATAHHTRGRRSIHGVNLRHIIALDHTHAFRLLRRERRQP